MNITRLQYFISVARHLSFSRAAEECYVSQTVISRQISALEEELGVLLFYRNNRQVELTPAGVYFFDEAIFIIQYIKSATDNVKKLSSGYEGILKLGIGPYEPDLVQPIVCRFTEKYPKILVNVCQFTYHILAFRYTRDLLDVAVCSEFHSKKMGNFQSVNLGSDAWVVAAHKDHPFWSLPPDQRRHLHEQTLIVLEDDFLEDLKYQCAQRDFKIR